MNSLDTRIQQFKQMAEADPDNELGHFSLGKALLEAKRFAEATSSLKKAIAINPKLSKAYQLLGEALSGAGKKPEAIKLVTKGVTIADEQGDRVPRDAMAQMLRGWGAPVPEFKQTPTGSGTAISGEASSPGFQCSRCGRPTGQLAKAPFKGALGQKILENVCGLCWHEWISMGTKVINELGLVLSTQSGQDAYDQYMIEFLQLED